MTVIVAGKVYVDPDERDRFVAAHRDLVEQSRRQLGCLDLSISPDPFEAGRVNLFEHWESQERLDVWRAVAPAPTVSVEITDDQVYKHEVSRTGPPFG